MSTKRKFTSKLGQPAVKPSAKPAAKESLNDSRTVVSKGGDTDFMGVKGSHDVVEISSGSEKSDEEESEDEEEDEEDEEDEDEEVEGEDVVETEQDAKRRSNEDEDADIHMEGQDAVVADKSDEPTEPSFGDLILANSSEPVDVAGAFNDSNFQTLSYPRSNKLEPPSGTSLGTVLTQALRTNDLTLLESCLQTPEIETIRATIQRLDSPLAGILLHKLAERLHRRPGRAGSLMVWVQWTLVTHGGYLATQPDLIKKLSELNRVIDERARGLQSLLSLKGKLDMLEAQMQLRQAMRQERRDVDDEDDEEGVIYVEGEEEDSSSNEQPQTRSLPNGTRKPTSRRSKQENGVPSAADDSEISEDMPTTTAANGVASDSEVEDTDSDDSSNDLIDDEAEEEEETDAESADEDEVDHSDVDEMDNDDDDSDDAIAAPTRSASARQQPPPSKMQKVGGWFSSKR